MGAINKYLLIAVVVLSIVVIFLLSIGRKVETVEKRIVDTVTVIKRDTIVRYRTKYITERVTDTIYIKENGSNIVLPRVQRHFQERNLFDAWVSGYDPLLDSIKVYPKTEYKTITNNVTKEVTPLTWKLYIGGGFQAISSTFAPCVSVTLATPKKWLFSANIGVYQNKPLYGVGVSYKILEK